MLLTFIYLAQEWCPWGSWARVGLCVCPPCRDRAGDLQLLVPPHLSARKASFHPGFKNCCCRWGWGATRCSQGECKEAPRQQIPDKTPLFPPAESAPKSWWSLAKSLQCEIVFCSVRLCSASKSPLLAKHTLQLQDPRVYPCFLWVPPPAQLSPWGRLFPHLLLLDLHQSSNRVPWERVAQLSHKQRIWDCSLLGSGIITSGCWARGEMHPKTLDCRRGGKSPRKVLDPWEKPEGCLGMRQEPSECQLQALGMSVTQEQLRRTLYVIYTSSMSISCNTRKLNQQCNILITKIFRRNSVYFSSGLSSSFTGQDIKIIIYLYL